MTDQRSWKSVKSLADMYGADTCEVGVYIGPPHFDREDIRVIVRATWPDSPDVKEIGGDDTMLCMMALARSYYSRAYGVGYANARLALMRATEALEIATENYMSIAREYIDNGGDIDDVPGYHLADQVIKGI